MELRPSGVVTFLFTDIEGSTALWESDAIWMSEHLAEHDAILTREIREHGGYVFSKGGDSYCAAFGSASAALTAAVAAQRRLTASSPLSVRMGLHAGEAVEREGDYFGSAVNRSARVMSASHGGQIVVTDVVLGLVTNSVEAVDLGQHRLAGIAQPVHLYQVVADGLATTFPPPRTEDAGSDFDLPDRVIGRDDMIAQIRERVGTSGPVTLVGPGGVGKTTLAGVVAGQLAPQYGGGVWMVDLTGLEPSAGASDIDVQAASTYKTTSSPALVVYDNCEHVLEGARAHIDSLPPNIAVIATSREPVGMRGERLVRVEPLAGAGPEAVELFRQAAHRSGIDIEASDDMVTRICQRLDGLPLAIELAASRLDVLTPNQLLDRLDDTLGVLSGSGNSHHATMRSTIGWSYDLLDNSGRELLQHLAVFDGFDVDIAERVAAGIGLQADGLAVISDLAAKSLVRRVGGRLSMQEVVRQFAEERLEQSGRRSDAVGLLVDLFAGECRRILDNGRPGELLTFGPGDLAWLNANRVNLRRAVAHAVDHGRIKDAAQIAAVYRTHHWTVYSLEVPMDDIFTPLLQHADNLPVDLLMAIHRGAGSAAWSKGNFESGTRHLNIEWRLHERTGGVAAGAEAPYHNLSAAASRAGDHESSQDWLRRGIEYKRSQGLPYGGLVEQLALHRWALDHDREAAVELLEDAIDHAENPIDVANITRRLAEISVEDGVPGPWTEHLAAQVEKLTADGLRSTLHTAWTLDVLSASARVDGDLDLAIASAIEAAEIRAATSGGIWSHRLAELLDDLGGKDLAFEVLDHFDRERPYGQYLTKANEIRERIGPDPRPARHETLDHSQLVQRVIDLLQAAEQERSTDKG